MLLNSLYFLHRLSAFSCWDLSACILKTERCQLEVCTAVLDTIIHLCAEGVPALGPCSLKHQGRWGAEKEAFMFIVWFVSSSALDLIAWVKLEPGLCVIWKGQPSSSSPNVWASLLACVSAEIFISVSLFCWCLKNRTLAVKFLNGESNGAFFT